MINSISRATVSRLSNLSFDLSFYKDFIDKRAQQPAYKRFAAISVQIARDAYNNNTSATLGKFILHVRQQRARGNMHATYILSKLFDREFLCADLFIAKEDLGTLRKMIFTPHPNPDLDATVSTLISYLISLRALDLGHARMDINYMGKLAGWIKDLIDSTFDTPGFTDSIFRKVETMEPYVKDKFASLEEGIPYATADMSLHSATKPMIDEASVVFIPIMNNSTARKYIGGIRREELLRFFYQSSCNSKDIRDFSVKDFLSWKEQDQSRQKKHFTTTLRTAESDLDLKENITKLHSLPVVKDDHLLGVVTQEQLNTNSVRVFLLDTQDTSKITGLRPHMICGVIDHHEKNNPFSQTNLTAQVFSKTGACISNIKLWFDHYFDHIEQALDLYLLTSIDDTDDFNPAKVRTRERDYFASAVSHLEKLPPGKTYFHFEEVPEAIKLKYLTSYITRKNTAQQEYISNSFDQKEYLNLLDDRKAQDGFWITQLKTNARNYLKAQDPKVRNWYYNEYLEQKQNIMLDLFIISALDKEPNDQLPTTRHDDLYIYNRNAQEVRHTTTYLYNSVRTIDKQPFTDEQKQRCYVLKDTSSIPAAHQSLFEKHFAGMTALPEELFAQKEAELKAAGINILELCVPHIMLIRYPQGTLFSRKKQITPVLGEYVSR